MVLDVVSDVLEEDGVTGVRRDARLGCRDEAVRRVDPARRRPLVRAAQPETTNSKLESDKSMHLILIICLVSGVPTYGALYLC